MGRRTESEVLMVGDNSLKRAVAIVLIALIVFLDLPKLCASHGNEDQHPSFKYSKKANEDFQKPIKPHEDHHHDGGAPHSHDHHHHHDGHSHGNGRAHSRRSEIPQQKNMSDVWLHSMGSTLLISAAPYLILYVIPLDNTEKMKPRLKVLLAFASGGLLGDAFLHLIPHSAIPHSHDHHGHGHGHSDEHHGEHSHDSTVGIWVLSGIITFLAVEKSVRLMKGGHGHSHGETEKKEPSKKNEVKNKQNKVKSSHKEKAVEAEQVEISGYLNLAADFAHNFTDGLAIGASYLAGNSIGIVTTITILFHEIPHEVGDFAILIKSGCSRRKAMLLQLVTALGALAGTAVALLGAGSDAAASWVLPFTAGGFIYIATVSVLPELLEGPTKLGQSLREIAALLTGVGLMVIIANFE